jgi:F-type H+-transporting ATPase subunit b
MPQLDISTWPSQLFWLAVTFAALYFVVSRLIIPRTGGVIEKRKSTIASDLAAAVASKASSEAALKAYEASIAEARSKASAVSLEMRNRMAAETDAARQKLDAELAAKMAAADKSVQAAKAKALEGITGVAEDIATSIVAELLGAKVSKAAIADAVAKSSK